MPTVSFNRPFDEQVDFFQRKLNLPAARYDSIQGRSHDYGFMVAGAMQADLVADLRDAVDKAVAQGGTLAQFRKDFDATVAKYGWEYNGLRNWRTQTIYLTNLRTSYAAGRYQQLSDPDVLAVRPLWRYNHSDTVINPRPEHLAWDGLILEAGDPWLVTHFPPNDYGCECFITAHARDELADFNKTEPDDPPSDASDTTGIGEGWDHTPGQAAAESVRLAETKVTSLLGRDQAIATAYREQLMSDGSFQNWYAEIESRVDANRGSLEKLEQPAAIQWLRKNVASRGNWPVAVLSTEAQGWLGAKASLVYFSTDTALKQIYLRGESLPASDYHLVQDVLDSAEVVIDQDNRHLVYFKKGEKYYTAVIKVNGRGDEVYLQTLHASSAKKLAVQRKKGRVLRDLSN
jgi:hypothetical protein